MDAAERAYEAAKQIVAKARETGSDYLGFNTSACRALTRLPDEALDLPFVESLDLNNTAITDAGAEQIARINGLETLVLSNTAITDAGAEQIARINGLEWLNLSNTAITDAGAEQIARINGLKTLYLDNTAITDAGAEQIARISGLEALWLSDTAITDAGVEQIARISGLERLWLNNTQIRDLRKLRPLPMIATGRGNLTFRGSLATQLDPEIARITKLSPLDTPAALRDYLATLDEDEYSDFLARRAIEIGLDPPPPPKGEPLPEPAPSPLPPQVDADGTLRRDTRLPELRREDLAREGWEDLHAQIRDLAAHPGLNNYAPLPRILERLAHALGTVYEQINAVRAGGAAGQLERLAQNDDFLQQLPLGIAPQLGALSASAALFIDRFPDWQAYLNEHAHDPPQASLVAASQPDFRELSKAMEASAHVAPDYAQDYESLRNESREEPESEEAATGLLSATREALRAIAAFTLKGMKRAAVSGGAIVISGLEGLGHAAISVSKPSVKKALEVVPLGIAGDIFLNHSALLLKLAHEFPQAFGWIRSVLQTIGAI